MEKTDYYLAEANQNLEGERKERRRERKRISGERRGAEREEEIRRKVRERE